MRLIKEFEEFITQGIVKKQKPDNSRAEFLIKESEKAYKFLIELTQKFLISDDNANSIIKICYDIIMELIRAEMLKKGFNASGEGAHEAEVPYLRKLSFSEIEIQFINELRYYRNSITYYGKILNAEYAQKVFNKTNKIYQILTK